MNTLDLLNAYSPLDPEAADLESLLSEDGEVPPLDRETIDAWFRLFERWDTRSAYDDVPYAVREAIAAHPEGVEATFASLARRPTSFAATVLDDLYPRRGAERNTDTFEQAVQTIRRLLSEPLPASVASSLTSFAKRRKQDVSLPEPAPWPAVPKGIPALGGAAGVLWRAPIFRRLEQLVPLHRSYGDSSLMVEGPCGLSMSFDEDWRATEIVLPAAWAAVWPLGLSPSQSSDEVEAQLGEPARKNKIASQWVLSGNKVVLCRFREGAFADLIVRWFADADDLPKAPPPPPEIPVEQLCEELRSLSYFESGSRVNTLASASEVHGAHEGLADAWASLAEREPGIDLRDAMHRLEAMGEVGAAAARRSLVRAPSHTTLFMARRALNAESEVEAWTEAVLAARSKAPEMVTELDDLLELPS